MRNKMKKSIILGVTFICVLLFTCFLAFAEETKETKYVGYSISDITEYRGDIKKAPESPEGGYIFSGWYEKDTTTEEGYEALKATELDGMTEGTVYAKFVPEEVLSVKAQVAYQLSNDTYEDADEKGAIRFLTSVDSLNYQKVGFKIKIGNGTEQDKSSNAVYTDLYVKQMDGEGTTTTSYVPSQVFCAQSQYFKSHTYINVTASTYRKEITVKPYWITLDGTQVEAPETNVRTMTVNDGRYWKYVHVDGATGNDETGAGTIGSPFKTINQALAEMSQCIEKQKQWNLYDGTNGTLVQAEQWEVYMAGEIEEEEATSVEAGQNIVLDTYGNDPVTIKRGSNGGYNGLIFNVKSDGKLTLQTTAKNLLVDGTVTTAGSESRFANVGKNATVTVKEGVTFSNHTCTSHGGTFYVLDGGTLHISKAEFMNNKVTGGAQGGAIYVNAGGATTITVSDSIFTGSTSLLGGAISFANENAGVVGSLQVTGCTFNENKVSGKSWSHGGAILIGNDVNCTLENNTFEGNTASALGNDVGMGTNAVLNLQGSQTDSFEIILMDQTGKIKVKEGFCPNTGAKISLISKVNRNEGNELIECANNTQAKEMVGYFDLQGDKLKTYALNDSAEKLILQTGGAIYKGTTYVSLAAAIEAVKADESTGQTATIEIIRALLDATVTIPEGYDIRLTSEGDVQRTIARDSAWTEDKPMFELGAGSALTFSSSSDSVDNIKLLIDGKSVNKSASRLVQIISGTTVNVGAGVEIANHTCKYDGGAFRVEAGGTLNISEAKFTNNKVTGGKYQGGAIYAETSGATPITISNSIFTENTSQLGGAISFSNSSKTPGVAGLLQVTGCTFNENKVSGVSYSWGGAILIGNYVNCTLENNTFEGNTASALGNDVGMGSNAVLNLRGSQTDSFEIGLTDPTGKIKVEEDFTPNIGTKIALVSDDNRTEGNVLVECADNPQAKEMVGYFDLQGDKLKTYALNDSAEKLILQTGGVTYNGTTYPTLAEAIEAVKKDELTEQTATIEIIKVLLHATVTIPDGYDITLTSEGDVQRTITRDSAWTEDKPMFELGAGSALTFASSSDSADNIKLLIDGKSINKDSSRLAIISSGTTVNVGAGVEIANNTCKYDGAVFYVKGGGTLHISDAKFTNNMVSGKYKGGAIYAHKDGATTISLSDSIFTANTSQMGGAISVSNDKAGTESTLQITRCTFNENKASGQSWIYGGAIHIGNYVNCTLENNTFERNTASTLGNDVYIADNVVLNLQGSQTDSFEIGLHTNTVKIKAEEGFVPNTGTKITMISNVDRTAGDVLIECVDEQQAKSLQSSFELNGDKLQDYMLGVSESDLVLQWAEVKYNGQPYDSMQAAVDVIKETANKTGTIEVINVNLSATVTIPEECNITFTNGGGVQRTIARDSAWTENKPMFELGAGSTLTFTSTSDSADNTKLLIDGKSVNKSASRLAIIPSGTTVNVGAGVKITNHTGTSHGGAFLVESGGTLHINKAEFTNNVVTTKAIQGGAIYINAGGATTVTVSDSIFTGNTSQLGGAISFANDNADVVGSLQITGCTFNENKVSGQKYSHGGAILIGNNVTCTLENNTFEGNTASALGNDVGMGTNAVLNLQGSQTDSFEIILMDKTGKIKVEEGFTPNTGTEITLISKAGWTEGDIPIECKTEEVATQVCSSFIVSPANNVTYQLEVNDKNLVLTQPEVQT